MIQWLHKTQWYKVKPVDNTPCRITKCELNHNRDVCTSNPSLVYCNSYSWNIILVFQEADRQRKAKQTTGGQGGSTGGPSGGATGVTTQSKPRAGKSMSDGPGRTQWSHCHCFFVFDIIYYRYLTLTPEHFLLGTIPNPPKSIQKLALYFHAMLIVTILSLSTKILTEQRYWQLGDLSYRSG